MNPNDIAPMIIASTLFVVGGLVLILRGPLGKALARRLEGSPAVEAETNNRVADLEQRVADLEHERHELGERLDFAERLLGQVRDAPKELR